MTTISAALPNPSLGTSIIVIAKRTFLKFIRTPQLVVVGTVQGAMFLLIFRYVFGGAIGSSGNITSSGLSYVDFLVPGYITTGIIFGGMMAAAGVAEDYEQGFFDRLRSLPIPRSSVLSGRAVADTATQAWSLALMAVVGFAVGFRLGGTWVAGIAAFALLIVFSFVFEWIFIALGLYSGNAQAAQGLSLMLMPFTFVSSAFVPVKSMPSWLQSVAEQQPVTYMIDSVRALTGGAKAEALIGHSAGYLAIRAMLWSVLLLALFAPLAIARYRRG